MGERGMGEGAGSARLSRRGLPACVRLLACAALLGMSALGADRDAGAFDGDRMVRAAAAISQRAEQSARSLRELLSSLPPRDFRGRLAAVNDHLNRTIEFADDAVVWGREDYWASPVETLSRGAGDCEDYAIAKYFSLVASGVPVSSMRLVYVRAMLPATAAHPARSQAHMVLAYYEGLSEDPLILDNLVPQIRRASERADLTPVFSFNSDGLWQGAGMQAAGDPMARLSRWRDVVRKARQEGFE
jgi:predicted transglutaminase-like cysteine proteinase